MHLNIQRNSLVDRSFPCTPIPVNDTKQNVTSLLMEHGRITCMWFVDSLGKMDPNPFLSYAYLHTFTDTQRTYFFKFLKPIYLWCNNDKNLSITAETIVEKNYI